VRREAVQPCASLIVVAVIGWLIRLKENRLEPRRSYGARVTKSPANVARSGRQTLKPAQE
jgi:hypothetical protein